VTCNSTRCCIDILTLGCCESGHLDSEGECCCSHDPMYIPGTGFCTGYPDINGNC
jgi:hypothetical protein